MMQQKPNMINARNVHCFCSTITAMDAVNKMKALQNTIVGKPTIATKRFIDITADTEVIAININRFAGFFSS